ncbi:MAG: ArsR/SmtB family transcription factor [Brevinema sp.]
MKELCFVLKALGDPNRLRMVSALKGRELCACQLQELIGVSGAAISQHMNLLLQSDICHSEKRGKWVYYQLNPSSLLDLVLEEHQKTELFHADQDKLRDILLHEPHCLVEIQKSRKKEN